MYYEFFSAGSVFSQNWYKSTIDKLQVFHILKITDVFIVVKKAVILWQQRFLIL